MIDKERTWLIWSTEHAAFWRLDGWGYTRDAGKAARYSWDEAKQICDTANRYSDRIEERMVKLSDRY